MFPSGKQTVTDGRLGSKGPIRRWRSGYDSVRVLQCRNISRQFRCPARHAIVVRSNLEDLSRDLLHLVDPPQFPIVPTASAAVRGCVLRHMDYTGSRS
jgi:hypothetical protein